LDIIAKAAFDPGFGHYEIFGLFDRFADRVFPCDGGKGLEIIPQRRIELLFNAPPELIHEGISSPYDGLGDVSFLGKFRIFFSQ
jgi:hypothetical protein